MKPFHPNNKLTNTYQSLVLVAMLTGFGISTTNAADVMLGAYVSGDGWNTNNIRNLNESSENKLSFINLFSTFSYTWENQLQYQANNIYQQGLVPFISFMPVDNSRKSTSILQEIIDGEWDAYLTQWAQGLKTWVESKTLLEKDGAIMLRFAHEFNATWYSYGNQPTALINAWQHVYHLFEAENVNNYIQWVWCANNVNVDDVNDITQYYPGDEYVDWTSIDGYNWGSNYSFSRWKTFSETFANIYLTLVTQYPEKPILLAELGSTEPEDTPRPEWGQDGNNQDMEQSKSAWVSEMLMAIPENFPAIRAISLFNINKELGWSLNGSTPQGVENSGLDAWGEGITSSVYTTNYLLAPRFSRSEVSVMAPSATSFEFPQNSQPQLSASQIKTIDINTPLEGFKKELNSEILPYSPTLTSATNDSHWPFPTPYWKRYWCCHWLPELCIKTQILSEEDQIALAQGPKPAPVPVAEEKLESVGLRFANCKDNGLFGRMKNRAETSGPELSIISGNELQTRVYSHKPGKINNTVYHYCTK